MNNSENEYQTLIDIGIITEDDELDNVSTNSYRFLGWSEYFWRRRDSHSKRPDPEIDHIHPEKGNRVLEIGAAYGRFTRKLANLYSSLDHHITAVELNPTFEKYTQQYMEQYPELSNVEFQYQDILNTETSDFTSPFDYIIIPMHTIHGFSYPLLNTLFGKIFDILADQGKCIFSARKNPDPRFEDSYSGSFDMEKTLDPLATVSYFFHPEKTEFGYQQIGYMVYYHFDRSMRPKKRTILRQVNDYIQPSYLEKIIAESGLKIVYSKEEDFSVIYCLGK